MKLENQINEKMQNSKVLQDDKNINTQLSSDKKIPRPVFRIKKQKSKSYFYNHISNSTQKILNNSNRNKSKNKPALNKKKVFKINSSYYYKSSEMKISKKENIHTNTLFNKCNQKLSFETSSKIPNVNINTHKDNTYYLLNSVVNILKNNKLKNKKPNCNSSDKKYLPKIKQSNKKEFTNTKNCSSPPTQEINKLNRNNLFNSNKGFSVDKIISSNNQIDIIQNAKLIFFKMFQKIISIDDYFIDIIEIGQGSYATAFIVTCKTTHMDYILKVIDFNSIKHQRHIKRIIVNYYNKFINRTKSIFLTLSTSNIPQNC